MLNNGYANFLLFFVIPIWMCAVFSSCLFTVTLSIQMPPSVFVSVSISVRVVIGYLINLLLSSCSSISGKDTLLLLIDGLQYIFQN